MLKPGRANQATLAAPVGATPRRSRARPLCRGVTLVEVLVALLVLSIGLIGLAALQGESLKLNHSAYMRAQATILASDGLDRLRANREGAIDGAFDRALGEDQPAFCNDAAAVLAAGELDQWLCYLRNSLPAADGSIAREDDVLFIITVSWDDTRGVEAPQQFVLRSQL